MLHDGGWVRLRKVAADYDPTDRDRAYAYIRERQRAGEIVTGLLYISADSQDMHDQSGTVDRALIDVPYERLCPGSAALEQAAGRIQVGRLAPFARARADTCLAATWERALPRQNRRSRAAARRCRP